MEEEYDSYLSNMLHNLRTWLEKQAEGGWDEFVPIKECPEGDILEQNISVLPEEDVGHFRVFMMGMGLFITYEICREHIRRHRRGRRKEWYVRLMKTYDEEDWMTK